MSGGTTLSLQGGFARPTPLYGGVKVRLQVRLAIGWQPRERRDQFRVGISQN